MRVYSEFEQRSGRVLLRIARPSLLVCITPKPRDWNND
jgi:hypothetical protein